jgi:hypothetical protein
MAETTENAGSENLGEPIVRFAVETPSGTEEIAAADIPEPLREAMVQSLLNGTTPVALRAPIADALGIDLAEIASSAAATAESADGSVRDAHAPGCACATDQYRAGVWGILDSAFPTDPHLWRAMEALFAISEGNPEVVDDEDRRDALELAMLHIQHRSALIAPPLSPVDQLIADFRSQLNSPSSS